MVGHPRKFDRMVDAVHPLAHLDPPTLELCHIHLAPEQEPGHEMGQDTLAAGTVARGVNVAGYLDAPFAGKYHLPAHAISAALTTASISKPPCRVLLGVSVFY